MAWIRVAPQQTIDRALSASSVVDKQVRSVAVQLEREARQLAYGRAVETGQLANSYRAERTRRGWRVASSDRKALWAEGGTGRPENTKQYGRIRVIRPRRSKFLRFPSPTSWPGPAGIPIFRRWVRGWEPQHILRDAGRALGRLPGITWRESAHPINRATRSTDW